MHTLLVTGGAGFIGSHYVKYALQHHANYRVITLDKLTYAGNLANLAEVIDNPRHEFIHGDIADAQLVDQLVPRVDAVINFAAESHVDRSIMGAGEFMDANAMGVYVLLNAAKRHGVERFLQVSTDEVYGSLEPDEAPWTENSPLAPRNPYAVSKAAGDMMARAFFITHGVPTLITRAANNVGPNQYPEKRVPLFITNAIDDLPIPVYGKGTAVRDHLYVTDHCAAIDLVLHEGEPGEAYNVGADNDADGQLLTENILSQLDKPLALIEYVTDRPGHDMRYALNSSKLKALGWSPQHDLQRCLEETVEWYVTGESWWRPLKQSGDFQSYYARQYANR